MSYTMADYRREKAEEYFNEMTPEKQRELVRGLTLEERFAGLSAEEITAYLKKLKLKRPSRKARPRRKD
jgi:hypothetical protein